MLLGRTVERGAARGGFRPGAVADLPMVLIAPVLMTAIWKMTFGVVEAVTPEGFLAAPLDLIAHGLMGAPERPG